MTTHALAEDISIDEIPELEVEDTNTQTQVDIEPPFSHEEPLISLSACIIKHLNSTNLEIHWLSHILLFFFKLYIKN
jgi:hypothetical protein